MTLALLSRWMNSVTFSDRRPKVVALPYEDFLAVEEAIILHCQSKDLPMWADSEARTLFRGAGLTWEEGLTEPVVLEWKEGRW